MDTRAIGFIEVYGFSPAILAADSALKTADVELVAMETTRGEKNSPGLIVSVKLKGNVDAVKAAVEAGANTASSRAEVIAASIIARPAEELDKVVMFENV